MPKKKAAKRFIVRIREVHLSHRAVNAADPEEALRLIVDGEVSGDEVACEYRATLHHETWDVVDEQGLVVRYPDAGIEQLA